MYKVKLNQATRIHQNQWETKKLNSNKKKHAKENFEKMIKYFRFDNYLKNLIMN